MNSKGIRQDPELYSKNCILRNYKNQQENPFKIVGLSDTLKELRNNMQSLRKKSKACHVMLSQEGDQDRTLLAEARELKKQISQLESREAQIVTAIEALTSEMPNLTSPETRSLDYEPQLVSHINSPPEHYLSPSTSRDHVHLGTKLDLVDFASAAVTSGWGYYYLMNEAAALERALVQYSISVALQYGFREVSPPSMVYSHTVSSTGFQPRDQNGEQQVYAVKQEESAEGAGKPEMSLAGTAEIPFASLKADNIIPETDLPDKIIGSSRSFRAEAGTRGRKARGLYRVHEFTKAEMFGWTSPDKSEDLFYQMVSIQTEILSGLGLYCRVLEMPANDLGASAYRKRDIEAYFPSRKQIAGGWGEVTSTSMCTDYQSRRMATRVKMKDGGIDFPHTVNGTALAVPRVLAALIENGWDEKEEVIRVPEVLWPWMHGCQVIRKKRG